MIVIQTKILMIGNIDWWCPRNGFIRVAMTTRKKNSEENWSELKGNDLRKRSVRNWKDCVKSRKIKMK